MPRIPLVEARTPAPVLHLPRPTPAAFGAEAFKGLTQLGEQFQKIATRLQEEQDKLDLAEDAGWFEGKLKETTLALSLDPDYATHTQKFTEAVTGFQRDLAQRKRSPTVRKALEAHIAKLLPEATVDVQAEALNLWSGHQRAALDAHGETLSQRAAEAATPEARDGAVGLYEGLLAGQLGARTITPEAAEAKRQSFRQKTLEKHMDVLRRTDRSRLRELDREGAFTALDPVKRLKILEAARDDEAAEERRHDAAFKEAQEAVERVWSAQANQGLLRGADVEAALRGEDPFITPDKARQLVAINDSPPIPGAGSLQVRAIMEEYHAGPSSQTRIDQARQALNHLRRTLGRPNTLMDKALNELQTDERSGRTLRATELGAGIKFAEDEYRSRSSARLLGQIGRIKEQQDLAEIRNRLRRSADPMTESKKIVDEYLKRREREAEQTPAHLKDVLELDK
jgi:hypothetical protein